MRFKHNQPCDCDICFHQKKILKDFYRRIKKIEIMEDIEEGDEPINKKDLMELLK